MKKNSVFVCCLFLFSVVLLSNTAAQTANSEAKTGVVTLYARDPLAQTFCFNDGKYGTVLQENEVRNRCSDVSFNSYKENSFSVGIEGAKQGRIIDLGTPDELQKKYGYPETVGKGQGFASIQLQGGKIFILKDKKRTVRTAELQELTEADDLFQIKVENYKSIPVKLGNIYLLRLTDERDKNFERIIKVLVTAYQPNESVTIRWQVILDSETKKSGE